VDWGVGGGGEEAPGLPETADVAFYVAGDAEGLMGGGLEWVCGRRAWRRFEGEGGIW